MFTDTLATELDNARAAGKTSHALTPRAHLADLSEFGTTPDTPPDGLELRAARAAFIASGNNVSEIERVLVLDVDGRRREGWVFCATFAQAERIAAGGFLVYRYGTHAGMTRFVSVVVL